MLQAVKQERKYFEDFVAYDVTVFQYFLSLSFRTLSLE